MRVSHVVTGPAQGHRVLGEFARSERRQLIDDGAVPRDHYFDGARRGLAFDANLLAHDLGRHPLAVVLELVRIRRITLLDVEVLRVGERGGEAPRHLAVVTDDDPGHARQRNTGDFSFRRDEVVLVPDGRHLQRQMRIVGEERLSRR